MPEIRPFRGWRYNPDLTKNLEEISSPLFDVVTPKQLEKLYANENAIIHLSVPKGDEPALSAIETLERWKQEGVILQDHVPAIYVYYQYFSLPGSVSEVVRKGFIATMRLSDEEPDKIYRHENTLSPQLDDRMDILETTQLNVSPTHGFYSDPDFELQAFMDDAMTNPLFEVEDYQGVRNSLAVIHDYEIIKKFMSKMKGQKVILGDGHHRLEASLKYQKSNEELARKNDIAHNYHMMYFTNSEADDIRILATHRLLTDIEDFDEEEILKRMSQNFIIKKVEDAFMLAEVIRGKKWTFGLLFKNNAYKLKLKREVFEMAPPPAPSPVAELDISIAHHYICDPLGGRITYDRSFSDCFAKILQGEVQMGVILNEMDMATVKNVCYSGHTLPAKSTYFYPKVTAGFVFSSINEDEFRFPSNLSF